MQRRICPACNKNQVAVNYKKNDKIYYRTRCDTCIRRNRKEPSKIPAWHRAGYKKKSQCEKCGFKSKHSEQFNVFHIDGDLNNCRPNNLKTICANCQRTLQKEGVRWRQGDLRPDF